MIDTPAAVAAGMLRFIRYAFMPNRLTYCGPVGEHQLLFEYGLENVVDGGLGPLLTSFSGALPYLQLIARANGLADPFDARVVEAYWIGNDLLERVEVRQLHQHLAERFAKQLSGRTRELVLGKAPAGARPHHSFHVLDIHSRLGEMPHSVATLDNCRVSWGRVVAVDPAALVLERAPVALREGKLTLGPPRLERALRQLDGRGFVDHAQPGDWVSLHWGWACEVLTSEQVQRLDRYTRHHLALANRTL